MNFGNRPPSTRRAVQLGLLGATLLASLSGCLSSRPALSPRYFVVPPIEVAAPVIAQSAPEIRLGRVTSAPHLRDRIAWRLSDVELAFDEESRWAVSPAEMLEESIERACFVSGRIRESKSRATPLLDVHLENFEGRTSEQDAWISLRVTIRDAEASAIASRIVRLELPLEEVSAEALARTLGRALESVATDVVDWVVSRPRSD